MFTLESGVVNKYLPILYDSLEEIVWLLKTQGHILESKV